MNTRTTPAAPSRNAPCPCGSGRKYKRCCGGDRGSPAAGGITPDRLQQALRLYQQGNLQAAAAISDELLHARPNDPGLLELSAVIALQSGRTGLAVERFEKQIRLQPGNALAHSNLCMALHSLGRDEEAFQHGQQAILLQPDLADAWNNLGNIYKSGNNLHKALEHYEKALELDGSDPRVHVNAGGVSQLLGNLEKAEQRYRDAITLAPGFAAAHNNLGTVLQKLERYEEAAAVFRQGLELEPGNPETQTNLASLLLEQGEVEEARNILDGVLQQNPGYIGAWINLGYLLGRQNEMEAANRHYEKALLLDPGNATVNCNLGYNLYELGEQQQAIEHFVRALRRDPNSAKSLAGLGKAMLRSGELGKASEYITKATQLAPWDIYVQIAKARLDGEIREWERAEAEWERIIEKRPQMSEGYIGLAGLYEAQDNHDAARATFRRAEAAGVTGQALYNAWCGSEENNNQLEEAERLAVKAREINSDFPGLIRLRAKLARRRKDYTGALELLNQVDSDAIRYREQKASYLFERGAVLDKLGRYTEAFAAYDEANRVKNEYIGRVYDYEKDRGRFRAWREFFSLENWQKLRALCGTDYRPDPCPVFIVGFPRSGTSLLEQILGSHPQIAPAGELKFIIDLGSFEGAELVGSELGYPDFLLDPAAPLDGARLAALRDYYLSGVRDLGVCETQTAWVTDKMPHNATHVGLISLLFPNSPIIHISRHPFNSCLSAYFANFKSHRYTSSLEATARHYRLVMELLDHYRTLPGTHLVEIHYEDLVNDQERVVRQVLEYVGAPWDEACLQHHKSKRVVKTASYEQVTEKIYRSSLYRYRDYREAVAPLIPILESTLARFGYSAE